ncbi:metal ABC transporter ATP-binding protein [Hippea jasoniae]|uniref:metal ABC transporter ATP-binding protein n=1 Tax=Hippea jasoniae TaxID=944479 RepID=UPI00068FEA86|nr:metal ABC transporter ATP-binding protein [Hippea jasoniae]
MIEFKNLTYTISGKQILDDINFTIEKGSFVAIVGPNGAGKTTLIKILLGLLKPTEGFVKIDGKTPQEYIRENRIGYLPQKAIVNWNMPLKVIDVVLIENLKPFGLFKRYTKEEIEKVRELLELFGIAGRINSYIKELSGGGQQRVSLARCLFHNPSLLVLDEPNTAVDAVYTTRIYEILKDLKEKKGVTVVMVTHDIGAISGYVDEIMCLNVKLHCHGSPTTIDYEQMIKSVYGENVNIIIHSEECKNCRLGGHRG